MLGGVIHRLLREKLQFANHELVPAKKYKHLLIYKRVLTSSVPIPKGLDAVAGAK
jgi:hypothetical protein